MSEPVRRGVAPGSNLFGRVVRVVLIVIGVSPFLPRLLAPVPGLSAIGRAFEAWFEFQCHRDMTRTLHLFGELMPVCSRCFGIYAGLGLGALVLRPRLGVWPLRIWVVVAALVMVLDVATETLGMRPEWTALRIATGILLAYPVGAALVFSARDWGSSDPEAGAR
jgi:uncharacterized membrane protein